MNERKQLANALMGYSLLDAPVPNTSNDSAPGLMGAAPPPMRQRMANALMGGMDYAGRGLALADLYSGGVLSSVAGLNPFGSYSNVMESRERALAGVPREAKAAATEPFNPLALGMTVIPSAVGKGMARMGDELISMFHGTSPEAAQSIKSGGFITGPVFLSDRSKQAATYGAEVLEARVPKSALKIDADLPGGRLLTVDEANGYWDNHGWTIDDYIRAGRYSFGVDDDVPVAR